MKALAEGGFQVGALSKLYYDGGVDLEELHGEPAVSKTQELLKQDQVTIYEAAIQFEDFLVRVDILKKNGERIDLIEVKAKSHDFEKDSFFSKIKREESSPKRGSVLSSAWEPYLVDVAFQTFVTRKAYPKFQINPYLCLVDKRVTYPHSGLHQCFLIKKENDRPKVVVRPDIDQKLLSPKILSAVSVAKEVEFLIKEEVFSTPEPEDLSAYSYFLASLLKADTPGPVYASETCKGCEFRIPNSLEKKGLKSGFKQCWSEAGFLTDENKDLPTVLDLWDNRRAKKHLEEDVVFLKDLTQDALGENKEALSGLSRVERQWLQVLKTKTNDKEPYFDFDYLERFLGEVTFPLHFIDFETTRVAIPFHKNQTPYEQIAYQFSHHLMHENGRIEHKTQFIHTTPGQFPNFEFARALMNALNKDGGTIFRYSHHENTTLNDIARQLGEFRPDGFPEIIEFIESITKSGKDGEEGSRKGNRSMIDLCEVVKKSFYHPSMKGSNSIKVVTPTILSDSKFLQQKYSKNIYGIGGEISSLNFLPKAWVVFDSLGIAQDPYKTLPPVEIDDGYRLTDIEMINEGGGASVAWARMQFTEMSEAERKAIADGLLRYCELDTLSMVWLFEYLRNAFQTNGAKR